MMIKHIDPKVREHAAKGMYYKDIAALFGFNHTGMYRYMKDKGIPLNLKLPRRGKGRNREQLQS